MSVLCNNLFNFFLFFFFFFFLLHSVHKLKKTIKAIYPPSHESFLSIMPRRNWTGETGLETATSPCIEFSFQPSLAENLSDLKETSFKVFKASSSSYLPPPVLRSPRPSPPPLPSSAPSSPPPPSQYPPLP